MIGTPGGTLTAQSENRLQDSLTPREIGVLRLLADGLQNKEIAAKLGISPKTVEFHKTKLYAKIGVTGLAGAIRFAIKAGYVKD